MQLDLFPSNEPKYDPEEATKTCIDCKQTLPLTEFGFMLNTNDKDYHHGRCKTCASEKAKRTAIAKKMAPPRTDKCDCCGVSFIGMNPKNIHFDHCDETTTPRGWLCRKCNLGLGFLGDNIEGVKRGLAYLERHGRRLSEEAHTVKTED